jgi:hypothetical protein
VETVLRKAVHDEDGQMARDIINRIDGMPKQHVEISEIDKMKSNSEGVFEDDN